MAISVHAKRNQDGGAIASWRMDAPLSDSGNRYSRPERKALNSYLDKVVRLTLAASEATR